ncbi:MAG: MotA/TolQ/ExbB proton channel family protein [Bacteroidetes bacterium]|nr:MotA/TolQ/ExbB proton channel family protein [Bacteroidota bacterium]
MNLYDLFIKGGLVMWPILLCSIIAMAVIIEKYLVISFARYNPSDLLANIRSALMRGDIDDAEKSASSIKKPIARILAKAISKYKLGLPAIQEAIHNGGREEVFLLEKRLSVLANISGIAPMLGFLGTVTGMIAAFQTIQQLGGNVSPSDLASGIWVAMLTTAFGLIVGIPALGFYNHFVDRVNRIVFEMEKTTEEFIEIILSGSEKVEVEESPKESKTYFDDTENN